MKKKCYYVYKYIDPRNDEIFYIGKGKGNRLTEHLRATISGWNISRSNNRRKTKRIEDILSSGLEPSIEKIVEDLSEIEAFDLEAEIIDYYKIIEDGGILLNIKRAYFLTNKDKISISESLKIYYLTHFSPMKGRDTSNETKAKQSLSRKKFFAKGGRNANALNWVTPFGTFKSKMDASRGSPLSVKQVENRCRNNNSQVISNLVACQIKDFDAYEQIGKTWKQIGYSVQ